MPNWFEGKMKFFEGPTFSAAQRILHEWMGGSSVSVLSARTFAAATMTTTIVNPFKLGLLTLKNRVVFAPLTRQRAGEGLESPD